MNTKPATAVGIVLCLCSLTVSASPAYENLSCKVNGSNDYFEVSAKQGIYSSEQFAYYQLIGGLTVLILHKHSLRFNRLTNLNLLPHSTLDPNQPPEAPQLFAGVCKPA